MKLIICGAGQVGYHLARQLSQEGNEITIIDNQIENIEEVNNSLDVRAIIGHGAHPDILEKAGAREADMLIAVTHSDEVNMIACQIAHTLFEMPRKIARIRQQSYLANEWKNLFRRDHMPIDVIISPELEVGRLVLRRLAMPSVFDSELFGEGKIYMLGLRVDETCPVLDTPLIQLTGLFPDLGAIVVGIIRDGALFVPKSDDYMQANDSVYLITPEEDVERTINIFGYSQSEARNIILVGGGNIGKYVAEQLDKGSGAGSLRVIENNPEKARELARNIEKAIVLEGSGLDRDILVEAGVRGAELTVALTNNDQVNILTSLMAREEGCPHTLCLVNNPDFVPMISKLGVDDAINPRATTISSILRHIRHGRILQVYSVADGQAEITEAVALGSSPVIGKELSEISFPDGVMVGAILREGKVLKPRGSLRIEEGDHVVLFVLSSSVQAVERMFRVSLEYF